MKPTCLFLINGLGLGNSTRCFAIIQHLHRAGAEVHVLTSGNGLFFFQNRPEVASLTAMDGFHCAKEGDRLSVFRTLAALHDLCQRYRAKTRELDKLLVRIRPDVMVIDSEYCVLPARRRRLPIIAINNSDVIVSEYFRHRDRPPSLRWQFWCIEFMDYLFHRTFCDLVLSPSVQAAGSRYPRFKRIGLIVRSRLLEAVRDGPSMPVTDPAKARRVVFMLSGSSFGSRIDFSRCKLPCQIDVVGRSGDAVSGVTFHGKLRDNITILQEADIVVINAGFSAVSEALVLNKPILVIPVPNHAEQYLNACAVVESRKGYRVDETSVLENVARMLAPGHTSDLDVDHLAVNSQGAAEAAAAVLEFVKRCNTHARLAL